MASFLSILDRTRNLLRSHHPLHSVAAPGFFLLGVLMGGLTVQGVLKKRIKLRESNERLNFSYPFFYLLRTFVRFLMFLFSMLMNGWGSKFLMGL